MSGLWTLFAWIGIPALALAGTPLFTMLGLVALVAFWGNGINSAAVVIEMGRLTSSPMLVAIPLFTFAGFLLAEAGTPRRLVRLIRAAFGWVPGGVSIVAMVACAVFTAFTGASGVTIIALGGLLMPALLRDRFKERFALGLLTTGGSLGILFPPSLALIIYSYVAMQNAGNAIMDVGTGPTLDRLFVAGIVPGILLIVLLSIYAQYRLRRDGAGATTRFSSRELIAAAREAIWEIPLPILLVWAIYGGRLTVTEAAAATAFYALVVEVFVYRDIPWRNLLRVAAEGMVLVGGILILLACALGLTNYLVDAEVPMRLLAAIEGLITNRFVFLLALNLFLLVIGSVTEVFGALIVVLPLIIPIAQRYGVDLTHLGIIFLANLEIGFMLPPLGLNLFISAFRFRQPILRVYGSVLPFLLVLFVGLMLITYIPELSLFLVK
ncbi:MAG: TRAP transporter large permease subunit [Candidatus Eisenbacteria bacterium]|nr:TRAP transporter large permease subunit [Candidatus Eisenbacteria bacterium]